MAVSLPSDLLVDVMRNADPVRKSMAEARLKQAARSTDVAFSGIVDQLGTSGRHQVKAESPATVAAGSQSASKAATEPDKGAMKGFEQMVLRNLFETLLPSEESGSFGGGPSAGIWRSMAADQLANVYANSGGIGIASLLAGDGGATTPKRALQWPYFTQGKIGAFSG